MSGLSPLDPSDPTGRTADLVWDRLDLPGDRSDTSALHSFATHLLWQNDPRFLRQS